jgi:hypothetical protein
MPAIVASMGGLGEAVVLLWAGGPPLREGPWPGAAGSVVDEGDSPAADHFSTTNLPSTTFSITPVSLV